MTRTLTVVSGLSGAGKTVALRTLEDLGYYCVDNLPVDLLPGFVDSVGTAEAGQKLAVGIDATIIPISPASASGWRRSAHAATSIAWCSSTRQMRRW